MTNKEVAENSTKQARHFFETTRDSNLPADKALRAQLTGHSQAAAAAFYAMEAILERIERLHQKIDRIEKKLG